MNKLTVGEFIEVLKRYDPKLLICIVDADTNWLGFQIHVDADEENVRLSIEYGEME